MITKDDELLCQQIHSTFDHVADSDPKWTERIAVLGGPVSGGLSFMSGLACERRFLLCVSVILL